MAHFAFAPRPDGWADVSIGDLWSRMSTTVGMDDPIPAMIEATIRLLDGAETAACQFTAEPPGSRWSFRRIRDPDGGPTSAVAISIVVSYDDHEFDSDAGIADATAFELRLPLLEFATAVLNGADCLLWKNVDVGYSERWAWPGSSEPRPFPTAALEGLRQRLLAQGIQSDLEWIAATGWKLSVTSNSGDASVTLERDGQIVPGRGQDLGSAISYACLWVKTGMPDCS